MIHTPENIEALAQNQVFVFGSNLAGMHGGGAALLAFKKFGARYGTGVGPTGQCYAIPTKDMNIETLPLEVIGEHVEQFLRHAAANPEQVFLVTKIGCGLAGYTPEDIAPLFARHQIPDNVRLPEEFHATQTI